MSTIQPQMNTANFANLAGSPKPSVGEAPQGLDFLTILAGSQAPAIPADGAGLASAIVPPQGELPAVGKVSGIATGKILPASPADFAARQSPSSASHPMASAKRFAGDVAIDAPSAEPSADAMLARAGYKTTKLAARGERQAATGGVDARTATETLSLDQTAAETQPAPVPPPVLEAFSRAAPEAPRAKFSQTSPDRALAQPFADRLAASIRTQPVRSQISRSGTVAPALTPGAPMPAAMASLIAEAIDGKTQGSVSPQSVAPSANVAAPGLSNPAPTNPTAPNPTASVLATDVPRVITSGALELTPIQLNRAMAAAPSIPAESLVAARAGAPAKPAMTDDAATPVQPAQQPAPVAAAVTRDADTVTQPKFAQAAGAETPVSGIVLNAASVMQETGAPRPTTANVAAQADTMQPVDFDTLVGRLSEAREAANPNLVRAAINHAEFGHISLAFRADDSRLSVTMTGADPALAPAVLAAASAAQAAGNDANAREQNAQNQQQNQQQAQHTTQQQQQQNSGNAAQSGLASNAQGQADRHAPDGRQASSQRGEAAGSAGRDGTADPAATPQTTPPGIYA